MSQEAEVMEKIQVDKTKVVEGSNSRQQIQTGMSTCVDPGLQIKSLKEDLKKKRMVKGFKV